MDYGGHVDFLLSTSCQAPSQWTNAWAEFVPFLQFDVEIRKITCTTNAIEGTNSRLRRAVNARGHFPTEQAALTYLYLALTGLDPTDKSRWTVRWKAALNAFDLAFDGAAGDPHLRGDPLLQAQVERRGATVIRSDRVLWGIGRVACRGTQNLGKINDW